jgi:hypothetical protein
LTTIPDDHWMAMETRDEPYLIQSCFPQWCSRRKPQLGFPLASCPPEFKKAPDWNLMNVQDDTFEAVHARQGKMKMSSNYPHIHSLTNA